MRHPDEGVIQGWVEAQLPAGEAAEVASHVAGCAECQALVAEIRGLMARSAGIVASLDGGAVARPAAVVVPATADAPARRRPVSLRRWAPALAAAVVVLAVMSQASSDDEGRERVREALRGDAGASAPAVERMPAPLPSAPPTPVPAPGVGASDAAAPVTRAGANEAAAAAPAPASPRAAEAPVADAGKADEAGTAARRALGTGPVMLPTVVMPAPSRAEPPAKAAASAAAPAPAAVPAPATDPVPMPMPVQATRERALMQANRGAPVQKAAIGATYESVRRCYRAIYGLALEMHLAAGGAARLVARDTTFGRWLQEGDSLVVRWRDSVAVFPAGMDRPRGRFGAVEGASLPLALVRGCP